MKLLIFRIPAVLVLLGAAASLYAQRPMQPAQLATASAIALPFGSDAVPASYAVASKPSIAQVEDPHDKVVNRIWIASMIAAVAGTSFDAASSWHRPESNPLLASSDGRFGAKGLGIKAGFAAGLLVPQVLLRKHKELKVPFAVGNFGEAAIFTGVAIHNLSIRSAAN